ncbi:MAG: fadD, partial [Actinomycetia bacterium]|nr:fadD [Actinomycetes bacterium]
RTRAIGRALSELAGGPGNHLAIIGHNRVSYVEVVLGATRAGLVYTPVKTGWTAGEIAVVLEDAQTRLVVTDTDAGRAAARDAGIPVVDLDAGFDGWVAGLTDEPLPYELSGWKLAYTSGTTGRPKGVVPAYMGARPFPDAFVASRTFAELVHLPGDGTHLFVSALFHGAPLTFGLAALASGATLRILDRWDPAVALALLQEDVTSTCMVPTMFRQLLALPEAARAAFHAPALRTIAHGGEGCPEPLKRAMLAWCGPVLVEYYGFTEGGLTVATSEEWLQRPGTVGRGAQERRITVRDADDDEVAPGVDGVVYFEQPGVTTFRYLGDEAKTAAAFSGTSYTVGDVGHLDDDGYLYITGRSADVIVSAGVNVYPAEIETVLDGIPGVADLAVVSAPDAERGETIAAFVVVAAGCEPAAAVARLRAVADEQLAGYRRPRQYTVIAELPRDGTGKLLRKNLRDRLWDGAPAR